MDFTRYLGLNLPVRTSTPDGKAINLDLSGLAHSNPPSVWDATTDPAVTDDSDHGYYVGSRWLNQSTNRLWVLVDDTPGSAVWHDPVQSAADRIAFGNSSDGSLRFNTLTDTWQHLALNTSNWADVTNVSGRWSVSGTTLTLLTTLQLHDCLVESGDLLIGNLSPDWACPELKIAGVLSIASGGTIRAIVQSDGQAIRGASRNTAGAGNAASGPASASLNVSRAGSSGSGGGAASTVGGAGRRCQAAGSHTSIWLAAGAGFTFTASTTTNGVIPLFVETSNPNRFGLSNYPRFCGGTGLPGGGGALMGSGASGEGGQRPAGGGILSIFVRKVEIVTGAAIHADGQNGDVASPNATSGTTSANLSIAGGGEAAGGGGGGILALGYGSLIYNNQDYSLDPYHADLDDVLRAKGALPGTPGQGVTRLDSAAALTAWAASTVYSLGMFRKPTAGGNKGYVCTAAGTSGTVQPTWPTTAGQSVTDGGVMWVCIAEGTNQHNPAFDGNEASAGADGLRVIQKVV